MPLRHRFFKRDKHATSIILPALFKSKLQPILSYFQKKNLEIRNLIVNIPLYLPELS